MRLGLQTRLKPGDHEKAINENTGAPMKVHTSNYKIKGFTEEAELEDPVSIGKEHDIPSSYLRYG